MAYVVCTSLEPSVLLSREGELLKHYHAELSRGLETRFGEPPGVTGDGEGGGGGASTGSNGGGGEWYSFEQFLDDYRVAFLDYMRCERGSIRILCQKGRDGKAGTLTMLLQRLVLLFVVVFVLREKESTTPKEYLVSHVSGEAYVEFYRLRLQRVGRGLSFPFF